MIHLKWDFQTEMEIWKLQIVYIDRFLQKVIWRLWIIFHFPPMHNSRLICLRTTDDNHFVSKKANLFIYFFCIIWKRIVLEYHWLLKSNLWLLMSNCYFARLDSAKHLCSFVSAEQSRRHYFVRLDSGQKSYKHNLFHRAFTRSFRSWKDNRILHNRLIILILSSAIYKKFLVILWASDLIINRVLIMRRRLG